MITFAKEVAFRIQCTRKMEGTRVFVAERECIIAKHFYLHMLRRCAPNVAAMTSSFIQRNSSIRRLETEKGRNGKP